MENDTVILFNNTEGIGSCEIVLATSEGDRIQNNATASPTPVRSKFCGVNPRLCICVLISLVIGLSALIAIYITDRNLKDKTTGFTSDGNAAERQRMGPKYLRIQPSTDDLNCILFTHNTTYIKSSTTCHDATSQNSCLTCEQLLEDPYLTCNGNSVTCCKMAHICNMAGYCNSGQMECDNNEPTCVCPPDKTGTACEENVEDVPVFQRAIGCHCYDYSYEFCGGENIANCTNYFTNTKQYCQHLEGESRRCYCENKEISDITTDPRLERCDAGYIQPLHQTNNSAMSVETSLSSILIVLAMGTRNVFH